MAIVQLFAAIIDESVAPVATAQASDTLPVLQNGELDDSYVQPLLHTPPAPVLPPTLACPPEADLPPVPALAPPVLGQ